MGALGDIGHFIITPLYYAISVVMVGWHEVWSLVLPRDGGMSWALSVVGLTVVIRAALIPLFVKQIKSSRNMQLIQPRVKELQKKYGHDREKLAAETMKLYKDSGTNPFASCLPILVQMPIFLTLFRLIDHAAKDGTGNGVLSDTMALNLKNAKLFDTIPVSSSFTNAGGLISVQLLCALLVLAMTATTFLTQRQLMSKNMPADALSGPYAQQQKMLLYILPVVFAVGGIAFPIGVLLYWTTSNLWTMSQQFYVIRNNPAPGTPAEKAKIERDRAKAERGGLLGLGHHDVATAETSVPEPEPETDRRPAQRQQPKRQSREQRRTPSPGPASTPPPRRPASGGASGSSGAPPRATTPKQRAGQNKNGKKAR